MGRETRLVSAEVRPVDSSLRGGVLWDSDGARHDRGPCARGLSDCDAAARGHLDLDAAEDRTGAYAGGEGLARFGGLVQVRHHEPVANVLTSVVVAMDVGVAEPELAPRPNLLRNPCGIWASRRNENGPRSCVSAGQEPFSWTTRS